MTSSIAIVGAGPAGATAAEILARAGFAVTLFEPKGAWEKPCGGGVTAKALGRYAYLVDDAGWPSQPIDRIELVGPSKRRYTIELDRPFRIYARARLNGLLLERAIEAGAEHVAEAVTAFERVGGEWRIATKSGERRAELLVGADGAGSIVRRDLVGRFRPEDVALTLGYNAPREGVREVLIEFPRDLTGYVWAFPRTDHVNFGIINRLNERPAAELKAIVHDFVDRYHGGPAPYDEMSFYGAKVPMLGRGSWDEVQTVGPGWALVGDAAGFVDPITGEGIYFAIRSGELLAEAIVAGDLASYDRSWREDFGEDLAVASHYLDRFYRGGFLGASVVDRALLFARGHAGFRSVLRRALVGEQSYLTLKRDLALTALRVV